MIKPHVLLAGVSLLAVSTAAAAARPIDAIDPPLSPQAYEPMSEEIREAVENLVVVVSDVAKEDSVSGTYDKREAGLIGGADAGRQVGNVGTQVGGVNVRIPVPVLQVPGMIWGGLSGATRKSLQEFRDALTEDIVSAESQPLVNNALALDIHRHIWTIYANDAKMHSTLANLPESTDAVLYVGFEDFKIDVQKNDATLILTAKAELNRHSDDMTLYSRTIEYHDTDSLANWTKDDLALWHDYSNFAAHYLARALAGEVFLTRLVPSKLTPAASSTAKADRKNANRFVSKTTTPELVWTHVLLDRNPDGTPAARIDPGDIAYDIEIYDAHRMVYSSRGIPATSHLVGMELEPCQVYRWSVRPSYYRKNADGGDELQFGEWMRREPDTAGATKGRNGLIGRQASIAPAYTQDFPELEIKCSRRR